MRSFLHSKLQKSVNLPVGQPLHPLLSLLVRHPCPAKKTLEISLTLEYPLGPNSLILALNMIHLEQSYTYSVLYIGLT